MNELLIVARDQLETCNLARETRLNLMNMNSSNEFLVCFLLVSDRFENLEELASEVINCLSNMNVIISKSSESILTIISAPTK